ncbi:UNVERIFIED_CONTAM: hypothetical protein K2H54_030176 [Gekko kuhli]
MNLESRKTLLRPPPSSTDWFIYVLVKRRWLSNQNQPSPIVDCITTEIEEGSVDGSDSRAWSPPWEPPSPGTTSPAPLAGSSPPAHVQGTRAGSRPSAAVSSPSFRRRESTRQPTGPRAAPAAVAFASAMAELGQEVVHLVWGKKPGAHGLADTIFCRWAQGFVFSESEPTALEQFEGGPCAVIAPVQAYLLTKLFTCEKSTWRQCQEEEQKNLLCHTLCDILELACSDHSESYCLATWQRGKMAEETASISESPAETSRQEEQPSALAVEELGFERFHALIHKQSFSSFPDFKDAVWNHYSVWTNKFGVLLFLYSVILAKGIENIKNEIEDSTEPLIDPVYGHGSQSLINLLLTGHAVSNVWDGDRECSGMKVKMQRGMQNALRTYKRFLRGNFILILAAEPSFLLFPPVLEKVYYPPDK